MAEHKKCAKGTCLICEDDDLAKIRLEILEAQRECAWCGYVATSKDDLIDHIFSNHP